MRMYSDAKGFTMIDGTLTEVTLKKLIVTRQSVEDADQFDDYLINDDGEIIQQTIVGHVA